MSGFKPGDVAMRRDLDGLESLTLLVPSCPSAMHSRKPHWHHAAGGWDQGPDDDAPLSTYRPLVVIDPEDAEAVARLLHIMRPGAMGGLFALQGALRTYLAPPRPEEPTGLGAVVEDAEGRLWVRWTTKHRTDWKGDHPGDYRSYANVAAVKVLSRGWSE